MKNQQKTKKNKIAKGAVLRRILGYLKHYRLPCLLSLLFAVISVLGTLYIPILTGRAIDLITDAGVDMKGILPILLRVLIVIGIVALAQWLMNICNNHITFGIVRRVRQDAFEKIQTLPLSYLDTHPVGDVVSRVIADADQFTDGLLMGFSQFFTSLLTILGTLVFMVILEWRIALIVVVLTPLSLFVASFITKRTYNLFRTQAAIRADQTALMDEMLQNHKTVTAFSYEDRAMAQFDEINTKLEQCSRRAVFFSSLTNPTTRFVNNLVYAAVALTGALICIASGGVASTGLTVGELSVMLNYAGQYTKPFNEISGVVTELQNALACADRLFTLIDQPSEIPDAPDARVIGKTEANDTVAFEHVYFSYQPERPLIRDFDLSVDYGKRVAIVGPTGCGKTTVINLLMRFYDVNKGAIRFCGTDVRNITRQSMRSCYGMVLQDTWLTPGTVRENIALGNPDADDNAIIEAAKAAHAHSFIRRLPQGYDTVIGEGGGSLSQGQKQLLCIARVFLCLPPVLILDEATSSIDTRTEMKIQNAFAKLMKGRTSFVVAHRLSTIREADLILCMKDGQIIETGNHETLMQKGGFYANLYNSQFEA
ncbi:aBC-type multidrug transport system ATPase and permease components [Clostridium sp. CAG:448]|nr:aBC-type multidrug transport system ATPase and permease components [Clostridium sp. CAG:448]